ncbi:MAG: murein biosynthesis integral membrane protein MurJ, partial [Gammaproteobacteria bacterium]|nr:murein biosynthesis integral membrane protein MurJ [Gammaproteobacteria bacterium]
LLFSLNGDNSYHMNLMKAMATVAGMTGLSRIAGFARDILTAAYLGAGPAGDAFFVALKLPNFFRRVTAEGAFSIAFVPIYSKTIERENKETADLFASNAFMVMLSILSVVTLLALIMMPYVIQAIAPGFTGDPVRSPLAIELARITFPYLLLMSLTALLGGVLNAVNRFAPFAFAPVLFNLSLITALLLSDHFETTGHALSWGVLVAGFLQLGFLWGCAKRAGIKITFALPKIDTDIRKLLKIMGPAVLGAGVVHINLFADLILASFLETGSISYLYYADRLNQLPLGVVGIAVGTALLPMLSRAMTRDDKQHAQDLFNRALEICLLLALPAAIALAVIPLSLVSVLFERGAFDAADSQITANVLMAYALGLPAYIAIKVFSTAHWARGDTKTPVRISIFATLLNIGMSIVLIQYIGVVGIALATGLTGWLQFYLHVRALRDHPSAKFDKRFLMNMPKILLSSCLMGGGVYILAALLQGFIFDGTTLFQVIGLAIVICSGGVLYGASILITGVVKPQDVKKLLLKKGQKT